MSIAYRPEIDGLRAVAVLSVLLCHANFTLFSGGYVGGDIFFVISGFLITSLIKKDLEVGNFSLINFWERRIRRILPPLFAVVASTLIAGWFLYLPSDYRLLGEQSAAQSIFASNILFKTQAGYFDTTNIIKPLLHTWSLAVEEQFYLFFPIAIFAVWKYRRDKMFKYFTIFSILSFIAAAFIVRNSPSSAFYLLPFRAWELLIGSLLALRPFSIQGFKKEILGWLGVTSIVIAVLLYDDKTLFPGATALLPCFGAAAIIASNANRLNVVGKILSMRIPVFIGLVSYSLYLWHWPILAFTRYSGLIEFTVPVALACLSASFVLAVLSWKFIEAPFRKKQIFVTTKSIYLAAVASLLLMAGAGLAIYFTQGAPQRLPENVSNYAAGIDDINPHRAECNQPKLSNFENGKICQSNKDSNIEPQFALWGDSFADALAPAFYKLSQEYKRNGYVLTAHGCPPILGYAHKSDVGFNCEGFNEKSLQLILEKKIKTIFLIANWTDRLRGNYSVIKDMKWYEDYRSEYDDITMAALKRTIDVLQKSGAKVYVVIDVPFAPFNPPHALAIQKLYTPKDKEKVVTLESYLSGRQRTIDEFVGKNKKSDVVFIDPKDFLCNKKECRVSDQGKSLYFNEGHLSNYGALYLKDMFAEYFRKGF